MSAAFLYGRIESRPDDIPEYGGQLPTVELFHFLRVLCRQPWKICHPHTLGIYHGIQIIGLNLCQNGVQHANPGAVSHKVTIYGKYFAFTNTGTPDQRRQLFIFYRGIRKHARHIGFAADTSLVPGYIQLQILTLLLFLFIRRKINPLPSQ